MTTVEDASPLVRIVRIAHPSLRGVACVPGDKLQVFLPETGMRTYTPVAWDAAGGAFELVVYVRPGAETPGVAWARGLSPGRTLQFFGPRKSIRFAAANAPAVLFGDETSIGVALALGAARPDLRVVLEVGDVASVEPILARQRAVFVPRGEGDRVARVADAIREGLTASGAELFLTGAAPSIQAVQKQLRAAGIRATATKAYWAPGKAGLD